MEGASWILWLSGADDGEAVAPGDLWPLRPPVETSIKSTEGDIGLQQVHWKSKMKLYRELQTDSRDLTTETPNKMRLTFYRDIN